MISRNELLESRVMRKYQARFGGGQSEKGSYDHLAGCLPYRFDNPCSFAMRCRVLGKSVRHWW